MSNRPTETWLALMALAVGALPVGIAGIFLYMSATATALHPRPQDVPAIGGAASTGPWKDAAERARAIVRAAVVEQNLPGLSVAVGAGGELVWAQGLGWADLETRVPVAPETRFRIGTTSSVFTAATVGLLLEDGRLTLDEPIQTHVPAYPAKPWPVTLRQVMGHLAGIRKDAGDEERLDVRCGKTAEGLQRFANAPLLFEPGTSYYPSSYGWILASAAVEDASGEPFFAFARRHVFGPLGMDDTSADDGRGPIPDLATYHFPRFAADPRYGPQAPDDVDYSCFAGAGAFLSTPSDLVRFGLAIEGGTLLQPATVRLLQTSQRLVSGKETGHGLGWELGTVTLAGEPTRAIGHDGELRGGMVTSFLTFPDRGIVVAVMSNTSFADTRSVAVAVAQAFARAGAHSAGR